MHSHQTVGVVLTGALCILSAAAQESAAEPERTRAGTEEQDTPQTYPKFEYPRFLEDWSGFDPKQADEVLDPIKHVDFNEEGSIWGSFGGSARLRGESWQNYGWSDAASADDTFILIRALVHADIRFGQNYRGFFQAKSALSTDRDLPGGRRTIDVDTFAVQQAFGDAIFPLGDDVTMTARVGRQALKYGKQRLVSPLPWGNTIRAWDGALARVEFDRWRIDGFVSRFAAVQKYEVNDWQPGPTFYGIYATGKLGDEEQPYTLDAYWLGIDKRASTFNGTSGREQRQTLGARLDGRFWQDGMDFDSELSFQFGDIGSADIWAWAFAFETGYSWNETAIKPRVFAGFDYASGDGDPGDGKVGTFNQLFPLGHAFLGYMDFVGRQNIIDLSVGTLVRPSDKWMLRADLHAFWRASTTDALYNAGGGVVRAGGLGTSSQVGHEIDLTAVYTIDRHLTLQGGYSVFFAGDFIKESGPAADMHWFYFQTTYRF